MTDIDKSVGELPPLPETFARTYSVRDTANGGMFVDRKLLMPHPTNRQELFTADQMRAYALEAIRAALQSAQAPVLVPDGWQITRIDDRTIEYRYHRKGDMSITGCVKPEIHFAMFRLLHDLLAATPKEQPDQSERIADLEKANRGLFDGTIRQSIEIAELRRQLAEAQARETELREALDAHHEVRLLYLRAKSKAMATCAEFKIDTLQELICSGYLVSELGKKTASALSQLTDTSALSAAIAAAVEPYKADAERWENYQNELKLFLNGGLRITVHAQMQDGNVYALTHQVSRSEFRHILNVAKYADHLSGMICKSIDAALSKSKEGGAE